MSVEAASGILNKGALPASAVAHQFTLQPADGFTYRDEFQYTINPRVGMSALMLTVLQKDCSTRLTIPIKELFV